MKIRRVLEGFENYGWETPTREIAEKVGLRPEEVVRLDTNTSPFSPKGALSDLARHLKKVVVNEYPDTSYRALVEGLSRYTGKEMNRFVVTNGADEGLDIIAKVFIDPGDEVIIPVPTYSMYRISAQIMGAKVRQVARRTNDFALDVEGILSAVNDRTRLIFVCNPNNPTGNLSPTSEIEEIARKSGVAVAVDEAYFELCGESAIDLTDTLENVIVCRTFSKAFSMAGVRVGYLVAAPKTVEMLNIVRPPNSLSVISLLLAQSGLGRPEEMRKNVNSTIGERARLSQMLGKVPGIRPYPSETNFILFKLEGSDGDEVWARLMKRGLVLRNLTRVRGVENCLRTTVGTPQVNDRVVKELKAALSG